MSQICAHVRFAFAECKTSEKRSVIVDNWVFYAVRIAYGTA